MKAFGYLPLVLGLIWSGWSMVLLDTANAQPMGGNATTESVCNFGMAKGEHSQRCEVPIPQRCKVAKFPDTDKQWTNVSKGGNVICRFDETQTDWKTRIVGACGECKTKQCSARFSVMFNCGSEGGSPQYTPQTPTR